MKLKPAEQSLFNLHVNTCPVCGITLVGIMAARNHLRWHVNQGDMTDQEKKKFEEEHDT